MKDFDFPNYFVVPTLIIEQISNGLVNYNSVILFGAPGAGKTSTARYYETSNPLGFKEVYYFSGFELGLNNIDLSLFKLSYAQGREKLIIIDGLDEIFSPDIKAKVLSLFKEGRKYGVSILITTRPQNIDNAFIANSAQVLLQGWDKAQSIKFVEESLADMLSVDDFARVANYLDLVSNDAITNPLFLSSLVKIFSENGTVTAKLIESLSKKLIYKNDFLNSDTINLDRPKIITDISVINTGLLNKVSKNPNMINDMSSRQFEELVAELFTKEGYNVTLTKATRDGGKDLIIVEQKMLGNFVVYVECKKYSMDSPVGVRLVRELYGSVMADRATAGILVTSSYFSNPAIQFKEQVKSQLSLIDYLQLSNMIDTAVKND